MKPILPGLYTFTGLITGRVYLIEDLDGLTLIDASIPPSAPKILKQIEGIGHKTTDVKRILITHGHPDHVGNLALLQRETGAETISSMLEKPVIEGKQPVVRPAPEKVSRIFRGMASTPSFLPNAVVNQTVEEGEIIETMGGLQVIFTPGHAPGHISFWQPEKGVLFVGDVLFNIPNLRLPPNSFTADMDENKRSVGKVARLNPEVMCFGHGNPITHDAAKILHNFAQKLLT